MPIMLRHRALLLPLCLCACAQAPYALDEDSLAALDGALPDSDPGLLDELDDPGHALEGEDLDEPAAALEGETMPLAPQLAAADALPGSDEDSAAQGLLFSASRLSLVSDTTRSPNHATVQLSVTWKTGEQKVCSGTLIAPDAVLTAAHCVFNVARRGFAQAITAAPAAQGDAPPPYGAISAKRSFAPKRYRDLDSTREKYPYDYGVVRLKKAFSLPTRTLGVGSDALGRAFVVRGYPSKAATAYDGLHMYESRDQIRRILSDGIFYHRASTLGGMSGAGIDDGSRIIGVHTSGAESNNSGVVFSPTSLEVVRGWATEVL